MEYPGQRNGGDHFSRIDVAFVFSVEGFVEIGASKIINRDNREEDGPCTEPTNSKL